MVKMKVTINLEIKAYVDDDDEEIRQAVSDKLNELIEAEELEFEVETSDEDDEE